MSTLDDLLDYLFDQKKPPVYSELEDWLQKSRRFKAFATDYRVKIRAKLRGVRDDDGLLDIRAELETAALLLIEKRFALEYEKYMASKQRGPDFTITFKTHTLFNVEVRRIRRGGLDNGDSEALISKLMAVLCDKVRQMPPSIINLLWLIGDYEISEADLTRTMIILRQLAENKDEDFFTRQGFESAAAFLKQYSRLSGIVLHQSNKNVLWLNSLARHKVLPEIGTAIQRLETL